MYEALVIIAILLGLSLGATLMFVVGAQIGGSAAETRVIEYVNTNPTPLLIRMANKLYGDQKGLHKGPWGTYVEEPPTEKKKPECTYPECMCEVFNLKCSGKNDLFI